MADAITHGLTALIVSVVLWSAIRARPPATRADGSYLMRYPWFIRAIAAVGTVLFATGLIAIPLLRQQGQGNGNDRQYWFMLGGYLLFFLVEGAFAIDVFGVTILVTTEGIESTSPWSGRKQLTWDEIVEVRWRPLAEAFSIVGPAGSTIRVPKLVRGIHQFCVDLRISVPPDRRESAESGFVAIDRETCE